MAPQILLIAESLKERISSGQFRPGSRFAPLRALAAKFGVSCYTIRKALDLLEAKGLIRSVERGGIYVRGSERNTGIESSDLIARLPKSMAIAQQITEDIAEGNLRTGNALPLQKILRSRYNASSRTMAAALKCLCSRGLIVPRGSGYAVKQAYSRPAHGKKKVVLTIGEESISIHIKGGNPGLMSFFQAFERELGNAGIIFSSSGTEKCPVTSDVQTHTVAGAFRWVEKSDTAQDVLKELRHYSHAGIPVVLYGYEPTFRRESTLKISLPRNLFGFQHSHVFDCDSAGAYLGASGHSSVAFISAFDGWWIQRKNDGVTRGLRAICGEEARICSFTAGCKMDSFRRQIGVQSFALDEQNRIYAQATQKAFSNIGMVLETDAWALSIPAYRLAQRLAMRAVLKPVFEEALRLGERTGITAWVCSTPDCAAVALQYLKENGMEVPRDLSILSLGDDEATLLNRITALDPQYAHAGYLAAHCIIGDIPLKRDRYGLVKCGTSVIERQTVSCLNHR